MATDGKTQKNLKKPEPKKPPLTTAEKSRMALSPSLNGGVLIHAFQKNVLGSDLDINVMIERLVDTCADVKGGDLRNLEAMLVGQATALQTIFTSLARRAVDQEQMRHYEAFLGLALKAQAQSRATISALVDLKYPRQATFVKQANIANGPQQVNNAGTQSASTHGGTQPNREPHSHGKETESDQNKLLEAPHEQPGGRMDTRAAQTSERSHQEVETVGAVHRAKKFRG